MRRFLTALAVAGMATFGVAVPAAATTIVTQSQTVTFQGWSSIPLGSQFSAICDQCASDVQFGAPVGLAARASISAFANWSAPVDLDVSYDPTQVAQGATATVINQFGQSAETANVSIQYSAQGDYGVAFLGQFPTASNPYYDGDSGSFSVGAFATASCALAPGSNSTCYTGNTKLTIAHGTIFGITNADISIYAQFVVGLEPDGVATVRSVNVTSSPVVGPDSLTNDAADITKITDTFAIPCSAPLGGEAYYDLTSSQNSPSLLTTDTQGVSTDGYLWITQANTSQIGVSNTYWSPTSPMHLTAPAAPVDLGPIDVNNLPPVADAGGPYSGNEGADIAFDGSGSHAACGAATSYAWSFSDGGTAYGATPKHAFQAPGDYTGNLTVTSANGSASQNFTVSVANLPPTVSAGSDTTAAWGRAVGFTGTATDPGADDQSSLIDSWDFGDGSAIENGNGLTHAYSTPGLYTAMFTACDRWGACASGTRGVTVRKRATTASYAGDQSGTYGTAAQLRVSLVDEFGSPIVGRTVTFTISNGTVTQAAGTATTDSAGNATISTVIGLDAGSYTVSGSFAGDGSYGAATASGAFTVGRKATSVVYTGATSGGMNKTVTLSGILRDASGTPMAGRTVVFQLGTQTVSAVTDSNGIAATSLKLSQKNGTYTVIATYTPSGTDSARYLASATSATFKLNTK